MICPTGEAKYFCKEDSTHLSTNRPTGKSLEPVLLSTLSVFARVPDGNQSVIPRCAIAHRGRATWREPGIHNHDREYGFRACASKSAVADLDNDIAELG